MPRPKRQKWRVEHAAKMRAKKKNKTRKQSEEFALTSSSNTVTNTNKYMKEKVNNLPLTECKTNTKGDIYKLGMGAREYKKHESDKKRLWK